MSTADNSKVPDDDDFLYGDIEEKHKATDFEQILTQLKALEQENTLLKEELADSKTQIIFLVNQKDILETNMATLYNTAVNEMNRKDKQIVELRKSARR